MADEQRREGLPERLSASLDKRLDRRQALARAGTGAMAALAALFGFGGKALAACALCNPDSGSFCIQRCEAYYGGWLYYWLSGSTHCYECVTYRSGTCWVNCADTICSATG
jgi:hypothetical protein